MENNDIKRRLIGLTSQQLKEVAEEMGLPKFTASQIAKWLYQAGATSIDEMTNISKAGRARLSEQYCVGTMPPIGRYYKISLPYRKRQIRGNGLHSRQRPRHSLRVVTGGMQDELPLLPDRKTGF